MLFDQMPEAMAEVLDEIRAIKAEIRSIKAADAEKKKDAHTPVGIERASEITGKAVTTLYRYTANGLIPCYKRGKSVLFYEDELLEWVRSGRCESLEEKAAKYGSHIVPMGSRNDRR
jgi:hypothetical protein